MSLPTKEGHLYKHKVFPRKWSYRYFKLNKTYFHSFETQHSLNPKDSLVRTKIITVEKCTTFPDKEYAFTVVSKSHDKWNLAAADETERKEWMEALTAHLPPDQSSMPSQPEKRPLTLSDDNDPPTVPTEQMPPIPSYMSSQLQPDYSAPPPYNDACSSGQQPSTSGNKGSS